jgi:hypothetical protein
MRRQPRRWATKLGSLGAAASVNISEFFDGRSRSVTERLIFGMDWPQKGLRSRHKKAQKAQNDY